MDPTTQVILVIVILVCLIFSGYFSATETAFTTLNKVRVKTRADDGNKRATLVLKLVGDYDRLLSTILIGNNIVNIAASSVGTLLFVAWCTGWGIPDFGSLLSTIVLTVLVLIFGEITPKSLAKEYPETFAFFSAPIINALIIFFTPLNFIFAQWKKLLNKIFKNKEDTTITDDELINMVDEAEHEGGINAQESELIKSAIEFNDVEVRDIFIPRVDVVMIDAQSTEEEVAKVFEETHFSRLPVYKDTVDNIIGILHEKDFIAQRGRPDFSIEKAVKPAVFVVGTAKISAVLRLLQKSKSHMAIVSGEFGDVTGIVTMEDILEELVGEIWDEHDEVLADITETGENTYKVLGGVTVSDFCDYFDIDEIESDSQTIGGWVMDMLGKVPVEGDMLVYENLTITVEATDDRRITELRVEVAPEESEEEDKSKKDKETKEEE